MTDLDPPPAALVRWAREQIRFLSRDCDGSHTPLYVLSRVWLDLWAQAKLAALELPGLRPPPLHVADWLREATSGTGGNTVAYLIEQFGEVLRQCGGKATPRPVWDEKKRQLLYGEVVAKSFRQKAENQTTVLAAFQEEGWPDAIDNPLADDDRLGEAVRKLNVNAAGLRFERNGNDGVCWRPPGGRP